MRHVPWLTLIATAILLVSPPGQGMLHSAFVSGEQLANSIAQFMLMIVAAIVVGLGALEWVVKYYVRRRRARPAPNAIQS